MVGLCSIASHHARRIVSAPTSGADPRRPPPRLFRPRAVLAQASAFPRPRAPAVFSAPPPFPARKPPPPPCLPSQDGHALTRPHGHDRSGPRLHGLSRTPKPACSATWRRRCIRRRRPRLLYASPTRRSSQRPRAKIRPAAGARPTGRHPGPGRAAPGPFNQGPCSPYPSPRCPRGGAAPLAQTSTRLDWERSAVDMDEEEDLGLDLLDPALFFNEH